MCGHCRAALRSIDQECPHLGCYCDHWPDNWADCSRGEALGEDCAYATTREYVEKFDFCDDILCDHKPGWQGNAEPENGGE